MPAELEDYQRAGVDALANGKILCAPVGAGKSIMSAAYYVENEAPKDVYVITTARKRNDFDWEDEFGKYGVAERVSTMGKLVVDSWNNIGKYTEVHGAFFIFDEQRVVGSGAWVKAFQHIAKSNNWIMLSATPGDTWLDYIPVFVANGFYKNRTAFKLEHVEYEPWSKHPKVRRYHNVGKLVRYRNDVLVKVDYRKPTERKTYEILVDYDRELFKRVVKDRWHVYENRPIKNVSELFSVMRKVVNSDASRLQTVRQLSLEHPKLIVFYNFDYELEILRNLAESSSTDSTSQSTDSTVIEGLETSGNVLSPMWEENCRQLREKGEIDLATTWKTTDDGSTTVGPVEQSPGIDHSLQPVRIAEWNGHKHEPIPKTDRWVYLVQYTAGAEGWNCIETDALAFFSLTYSYKAFHQAHGRIDRMNTPFKVLNYYILKSESAIDKAVWRSLEQKKSFNESDFEFDEDDF